MLAEGERRFYMYVEVVDFYYLNTHNKWWHVDIAQHISYLRFDENQNWFSD